MVKVGQCYQTNQKRGVLGMVYKVRDVFMRDDLKIYALVQMYNRRTGKKIGKPIAKREDDHLFDLENLKKSEEEK